MESKRLYRVRMENRKEARTRMYYVISGSLSDAMVAGNKAAGEGWEPSNVENAASFESEGVFRVV